MKVRKTALFSILIIGMAVFGLATFLPADTKAAQIDVYLEGAYDDTYLDV